MPRFWYVFAGENCSVTNGHGLLFVHGTSIATVLNQKSGGLSDLLASASRDAFWIVNDKKRVFLVHPVQGSAKNIFFHILAVHVLDMICMVNQLN